MTTTIDTITQTTVNTTLSPNDYVGHGTAHNLPTPILFIFGCCAVGALSRTILKFVPRLPYTVLLLMVGFFLGFLSNKFEFLREYTTMANLDPHTILHVFLPVLIFESAYAMEAHTFFKSFTQIFLLAAPGLCVASFLTALFCKYVYSYNWSWNMSMMFGCLISATDPVAVVALLKELGASKQLSILLEGESLLNDGAAIVLFELFNVLATPGTILTTADLFLTVFFKIVLSPIFGFLMAKITIFWLVNIFNDALTEITITLASTYITFYVADGLLDFSGVLSVVVLGIVISANRTSISPEVETFLHRFWEMLAYLANTLIFILVGMVIAVKAVGDATAKDIILVVSLYCAITVSRAIVMLIFNPLLKRLGYGMTWRTSTVMIWGGLRGAVGLAMALIVYRNQELDPTGNNQSIILLHTAGIVLLTLLINGTTIQPLLTILGMDSVSIPKRMAMASAVRALQDVVDTSKSLYKTDRFLADSDWDIVEKFIEIKDPYETMDEEAKLDQLTNFERKSKCPKCTFEVPNEPSPTEWKEMIQEARLRLLKAEKISYWKQFEHGMLSREAVRKLNDLVDYALDRQHVLVDTDDLSKTWKIKGFYEKLKAWLDQKTSSARNKGDAVIPVPLNKFLQVMYKICMHTAFEVVIYILILTNVSSMIYELIEENSMCADEFYAKFGETFSILNYIFIVLYTVEAVMKILAFRRWYFKSKWNWFDFVILILSYLDIILEETVFEQLESQDEANCDNLISSFFSPSIFRIAKAVRLLRLLRSLRLVRLIIPQLKAVVDRMIAKKLRFGFDVGKGYVMGEEEVQNFLELMIDNEKIAGQFKERLSEGRAEIIKELGLLQKLHPGVAVSIKTQQAARRILNNIHDKIMEMKGEGVLDEGESGRLTTMVEVHMKQLLKIPPSISPPPAEKIIGNLSWVQGDETLIGYIKHNAELVTLTDGERLDVESDPKGGIYVIISGLVKVDKFFGEELPEQHEVKSVEKAKQALVSRLSDADMSKISDYMSTGSVLGELALLTGNPSKIMITCETSTQLYHIPYEAIQAALELFIDEPSLEYRLWRVCSIRVATTILKNYPQYLAWSPERLKMQMEKCILFVEKTELPEGGKSVAFDVFDITVFDDVCDVVLIYGVTENAETGRVYKGPCYIPSKVEKLVLIPGKTDKHVIFLLPRDNTGADNTGMLNDAMESHARTASHNSSTLIRDTIICKSAVGGMQKNASRMSSLCLTHAAKERDTLMQRISSVRMHQDSKSSLSTIINKVSRQRLLDEEDDDVEMAKITDLNLSDECNHSNLSLIQDRPDKSVKNSIEQKRSKSDVGVAIKKDKKKDSAPSKKTTKETFPPISSKPSPLVSNTISTDKPAQQPSPLTKTNKVGPAPQNTKPPQQPPQNTEKQNSLKESTNQSKEPSNPIPRSNPIPKVQTTNVISQPSPAAASNVVPAVQNKTTANMNTAANAPAQAATRNKTASDNRTQFHSYSDSKPRSEKEGSSDNRPASTPLTPVEDPGSKN